MFLTRLTYSRGCRLGGPFFLWSCAVHLLYLDESGSVADPNQRYFVLAGVSVFKRKTHWIEQPLNDIAKRFAPEDPYGIELHGSPMRSGRDGWKAFPLHDRLTAIKDGLSIVRDHHQRGGVRLFGAVIKKSSVAGSADPVEHAFEQLANRFDLFLQRRHRKHSDPQRGMILFDKSSTELRIQAMAREFKQTGHAWGRTRTYAEVPVFLDSKASRLIQLADLVAFALFRFYEHSDNSFYDVVKYCFDSEGGVEHGLYVRL